jgi:hypothetical protein
VSRRRIGTVKSRYDWADQTLGITVVDTNSWEDDWDLGGDGLHINRRGARTPRSALL